MNQEDIAVKWCCTVRTAVGCNLSTHVHFILFVYHCEVCDHNYVREF
jgi:hypothetical protein